jgi:lipoprotein-releasing system permease protein
MFRPISIYIGLRYTRAKSRNQFISFISFVSVLGIALGVTVLITVLSVVNGFDKEIKKQIFGMISPITIHSFSGSLNNWQELNNAVKTTPQVTAVAPYVSGQAMLTNSNPALPAMLVGILPSQESGVSTLDKKIIQGDINHLTSGSFGIVLGKVLAEKLNAIIGDEIRVVTLRTPSSFSSSHISPQYKKFKIIGIFQAGGGSLGFDSKMAFIHLKDAQTLFALGSSVSGLHVNINDMYAAPLISQALEPQMPPTVRIWNWTDQLGDFFENIRLTKTMMFFIFALIIAVAAFNLICTMVMVVRNKQADIAILRTLGATPALILAIFIVQGTAISLMGTLLGIAGGIALASNITFISTWIQNVLHMELVSSNVYFVNYLPSDLQWPDVWHISIIALILSLLATIYPAWNASRVTPVEGLNSD